MEKKQHFSADILFDVFDRRGRKRAERCLEKYTHFRVCENLNIWFFFSSFCCVGALAACAFGYFETIDAQNVVLIQYIVAELVHWSHSGTVPESVAATMHS